jgi:hypothetical protein
MNTSSEIGLLLPVIKEGDRYVWDRSQPAGLDDLPRYESLRVYLQRHYKSISSYIEWNGLTITSTVFEPADVNDLTYALIDTSVFDSSGTEKPPFIG